MAAPPAFFSVVFLAAAAFATESMTGQYRSRMLIRTHPCNLNIYSDCRETFVCSAVVSRFIYGVGAPSKEHFGRAGLPYRGFLRNDYCSKNASQYSLSLLFGFSGSPGIYLGFKLAPNEKKNILNKRLPVFVFW